MGMMRNLFRPGKGRVHQRFTAAFINGTTVYPGDTVVWDHTAPASQGGTAGTLEGETLGATDFVYVILPPAASGGHQAGIVIGDTVSRAVPVAATTFALTNDQVGIIQTWGVCPDVFVVTNTDGVKGSTLMCAATTGALTQVLATDVVATDATFQGEACGFVLTTQATDHTRATVATEPGLDMFVRCDF